MKISKKYIFILLERQVNNQENIYGQRLPFINKYIRRKVGGLTVVKVVSLNGFPVKRHSQREKYWIIRIINNYNKSVIFFQKAIDNTKRYIKYKENQKYNHFGYIS